MMDVVCRFCKPLDTALVSQMAKEHGVMIIVEEGSIGGFGSHGKDSPSHVVTSTHLVSALLAMP